MTYVLHLAIMIGIYAILAYSLNLVIGMGGLLSLCHGAFYGIGAYIFTLLGTRLGIGFLFALVIAMLGTGAVAALLGLTALRFRGDSFVLVTLGFQMIVYTVLHNWIALTNGPHGISGIGRPVIFGWQIDSQSEYLLLVALLAGVVGIVLFSVYQSPFGLALRALRDNEKAAEALGKPAFRYHLRAFILSGAVAASAGALYAAYVTYIDPTSFTLNESIFLVVILLLGGAGNRVGPIVGVLLMVLLPEALRFVGLPDTLAPNVRQMVYGLILVVLMYYRPKGIAGAYAIK
jgi:branched-chain amino acid transport system permease protein